MNRTPEPHRTLLIQLLLWYLSKFRRIHHYKDYNDIKDNNDAPVIKLYLGELSDNIRN